MAQTKQISIVAEINAMQNADTLLVANGGGGIKRLKPSNLSVGMVDGRDADHIGNVGSASQDGRHFTATQGWIRVAESTTLMKRSFTGLLMVTQFFNNNHGEAFTLAIAGEFQSPWNQGGISVNTLAKSRSTSQFFDKVRIGYEGADSKAYIDLHYSGTLDNGVRLWAFGTLRTYAGSEVTANPTACARSVEFNI